MCPGVLGGTKQTGLKSSVRSPAEGRAVRCPFHLCHSNPGSSGFRESSIRFYESEIFEILYETVKEYLGHSEKGPFLIFIFPASQKDIYSPRNGSFLVLKLWQVGDTINSTLS